MEVEKTKSKFDVGDEVLFLGLFGIYRGNDTALAVFFGVLNAEFFKLASYKRERPIKVKSYLGILVYPSSLFDYV